tara:strand:+ start:1585 stop:2310 length:726 start_codon:yes stop_codon:yes gene_type:complete
MRKILVIFKWIAAIILLVVLLVFTDYRQSVEEISLQHITIKESTQNFVSKRNVLHYLQDKFMHPDSISTVNFNAEDLENLLEKHPAVKQVEVFLNQKGDIQILIEQNKALIRIKSNTEDYYLDEFGERMELSDEFTPALMVATGDITIKDHSNIYDFVNEINKSDFWNAQITQIHFDNDDLFLIPRVGSQKINIGSFDNLVEKLENLYQFYIVSMPVKGWQAYSDINLKFKNQIVCTKNKK